MPPFRRSALCLSGMRPDETRRRKKKKTKKGGQKQRQETDPLALPDGGELCCPSILQRGHPTEPLDPTPNSPTVATCKDSPPWTSWQCWSMCAVEEECRCRVETVVRAMCVCDNDGGGWAKALVVAVPGQRSGRRRRRGREEKQLEGSERQEEEGCLVKWCARREAG